MFIGHFLMHFRAHRRCRQTAQELGRYSDRQLSDIGIIRSEIDRIAWQQFDNN